MDLASVVAALASVGVRVSGSAPNSSVQVDSSRACPPGLAGPEPSGTIHDLGQHFHIACSWWYPPRTTDAEMTADMDASIPWNFNGPRPDFRLGDCHYSTADNMFCRVAGGDG